MRRFFLWSLLLWAAAAAAGEPSLVPTRGIVDVDLIISPDVPVRIIGSKAAAPEGGPTLQTYDIVLYHGATSSYTTVLSVPGAPAIGGVFKLDALGGWLFSIETPSTLAGSLGSPATGRDIVRYNSVSTTYSRFFCGDSLADTVPETSRIDAFYLEGGDAGSLVMSFDVPTKIGVSRFQPADLVKFTRTGATCSSWQLAALNPHFNSVAAGIPTSANVIGAARYGGRTIFALDVPRDLGPMVGAPAIPGEVIAWDGASLTVFTTLADWPINTLTNGVATTGNPGEVADSVRVRKSTIVPGAVVVTWTAGCSEGATDYGVFEGTIGTWYSHGKKTCTDAGDDFSESFLPGSGNHYYLVVPLSAQGEGSYGRRSNLTERPPATIPNACVTPQILTPCPP